MPIAEDIRSTNRNGTTMRETHASPPLGLLAIAQTALALAGIGFLTRIATGAQYPVPWDSGATISAYFTDHPFTVMASGFLQFGAAVVLGLFTASFVSRLQFMGAHGAGTTIAMIGAVANVMTLALSALILWVASLPVVAEDVSVIRALYYLTYILGGTAATVCFGVFVAGSVFSSQSMRLLPGWLDGFGVALATCAALSWFSLIWPLLLFLVPLTRFAGFVWLIAAGFSMPKSVLRAV